MAKIPTPRSWNQILGDMVDAFLSRFGLKSLKVGSPVLSILEAAAQSDLRSSQQIFDLLNAKSLDRATGVALDRIGLDEDLVRLTEGAAGGTVTITDTSFTKISSKIYQGQPAPIVGSNRVYVTDASLFPASGKVYLGRGTSNYEGPLNYTSKTNNGTYWTLNLSDNTRRFHNLGESIIVAQGGNRVIPSGALVQTPQGNTQDAVKFATLFQSVIPDGETQITSVQVIAQKPGVGSNVSAGAISSFVTTPFTGASVTNSLPFTNGQAAEDDKTFRERIRATRQSRSKGTALALKTSVQGVVAPDENKRIASSSVITRKGYPTTLYIDDGTGYEEKSLGVAVEPLVDLAFGGEQYFQVAAARPISKAFVISVNAGPFQLVAGSRLAVKVGGVIYEHSFDAADFRSISNATAYEIAASINSNPLLGFSAATADSGTRVRLFARGDTLEDIEVVSPALGDDANPAILFPGGRVDTMRLYRNDRMLSKDGKIATLLSRPPAVWGAFASGETLILAVDGTALTTYTFVDQDFVDAGTGFTAVGRNTLAAWVKVLNAKIPGLTVKESNGLLELTSNSGTSSRAKIQIQGGTLVAPGQMFAAQTVQGADRDYTLDRNTGQIRLETPLVAGDTLSAGTLNTRAFLESLSLGQTSISVGGAHLWFAADGDAQVITTGLNSATGLLTTVSRLTAWGNRIRITANNSAFANVRAGDWMIAWDTGINQSMRGTFRVAQAASTYVEIERQAMNAAREKCSSTTLANGKVLVAGGRADNSVVLASAELYDPATDTWTATGSMNVARYNHSAILLANGKVLVLGGENTDIASVDAQILASAELYDPSTGTWTTVASMPVARVNHAVGLLTSPSEAVIVAGGRNKISGVWQVLASAYLYDPSANIWTAIQDMITPRYWASGVALSGGTKFLVAGGATAVASTSTASELYDRTLTVWSAASALNTSRAESRAVLLQSGKVLVAGGVSSLGAALTSAEVFDPAGAGTWTATGSMNVARQDHVLALMGNGQALAAFGQNTITAETWNSSTNTWTTAAVPKSASYRNNTKAATLANGNILVAGGSTGSECQASAEIYSYGTNSWAATDQLATQPTGGTGSFNLTGSGLVFVRASSLIQSVTIPAGTNYTAKNFVDSLNQQLQGAGARTFRTNKIRVTTKSYGLDGDVAMVTADVEGLKLGLTAGSAVSNLSTHLASVISSNGQAGTPEFTLPEIVSTDSDTRFMIYSKANDAKIQNLVVGLRSLDAAYNTASPIYRQGHNGFSVSGIQDLSSFANQRTMTLRQAGVEWIAKDRLYLAAPYALGPAEDLTVVADQDAASKRFTVPMFRKLKPVDSTYGSQNAFKDADNGNQSLAVAFGLSYDFNDFALYMAARAKTDADDATKTILWRYTRLGPDGESARLRFVYPDAPSQTLNLVTDTSTGKYTSISVTLPSGGLKSGYQIRNATKVGTAAAAGPRGLRILSYVLGYPVASATRDVRIKFTAQTVDFQVGETITGTLSGATATVDAIVSDAGTTGVLRLTSVAGTFHVAETLTGSLGGAATSNGSQYYQVTLTLTLPNTGAGALATINNHGLQVGDGIYLASSNANFPPGLKTITEVTATTLSYVSATTTVTTATNIGTISFDAAGEASFSGATPTAITVSDLLRVESTASLPTDYKTRTLRISYFGPQVIQGYVETFGGGNSSTPTWTTLGTTTALKIFGLNSGAATASALATAVQALANANDSTCPVTATSSGSGIVDMATFEDTLTAGNWIYLTDGVNYVKSTVSPGSVAGDYQLVFKKSINSDLATASDWANEDVRLVPLSTKSIAAWLNTVTVTGLSTACAVDAADQAQKLQIASLTAGSAGSIQIQGGSSNSATAAVSGAAALVTDPDTSTYAVVTVKKTDAQGLMAGTWVAVQNSDSMPKSVIQATTTLTSWSSSGVMVFDSAANTPLWQYANSGPVTSKTWQIERQGQYICYRFNPNAASGPVSAPDLTGVKEGDWVRVTAATSPSSNAVAVSSVNQGIYRIIRVEDGTVSNAGARGFWIENENAITETVELDAAFYSFDSIMPGDKLSISTDLWGSSNKGTWTVETVGQIGGAGAQFVNSSAGKHTLKVSVADRAPVAVNAPGPGALGSIQYRLVQVLEAAPSKLIKRILTISPNQADGRYVDIKLDTSPRYALISGTAGSVLTALDKFGFSTDLAQGTDGYSHTTGLIAEANRILYGDTRDPAAYPGVVAAGANVNISGPLVKRITCALNLRIRSGVSTTDVTDRVRSAVASVVNKTGIGQSIAISDIINAASRVNGVVAVAVVSPAFSAETDLIPVQPYEKPLVLSLEQDVLVSFAGE